MTKHFFICALAGTLLSGCGINQSGNLFPWDIFSNSASQTVEFNGDKLGSKEGAFQRTDKHKRIDSRQLYGIRDDDPWDMR